MVMAACRHRVIFLVRMKPALNIDNVSRSVHLLFETRTLLAQVLKSILLCVVGPPSPSSDTLVGSGGMLKALGDIRESLTSSAYLSR